MVEAPKTVVKIVFGAMTLGRRGADQVRVHSLEESRVLLDTFQSYGHNEVDTALIYGGGSSEEYLGQLHWQDRGIIMDTKFSTRADLGQGPGVRTTHSPENLRKALQRSLKSLQTDKIDMWYLHSPDRSTPYEVTLQEVNNLYEEGYFKRFGISNYMSWEVAQMCEICERNGWVKPSVYQGIYNVLHRAVELELFPCLRKYGISFYEFNPLAGGYLTDRYHRNMPSQEHENGSRFDPNSRQGQVYRQRYWNEAYFDALDILRPVAKKYGLSEAECALRWMANHSMLRKELGDAIIIGASSAKQLNENLANLEKGPLPDEVLKALNDGWARVKGVCVNYFH